METIYTTLSGLKGLPVDFISVTYGAGGSDTQKNKTCEIASLIKREYGIEPVAHLTCVSSTREELKATLAQLKENGIENILALRGDIPQGVEPKHDFYHANELASFIKAHYPECNLLGACYPEVHSEAKDMDQDIQNLKHKVDAGVSHLITQLFFDNSHFYHFMEKLRAAGVDTPVEAGIMPLTTVSQVQRMVSMCGASVPNELSTLVQPLCRFPGRFGQGRHRLRLKPNLRPHPSRSGRHPPLHHEQCGPGPDGDQGGASRYGEKPIMQQIITRLDRQEILRYLGWKGGTPFFADGAASG